MRIPLLHMTVAAALLAAAPAVSSAQSHEEKRVTDSAAVLETLVRAPDNGIPQHILERAEAIVVIPSLVKGGFIIGAQHGRGVMSVRNRDTNKWSAPGSWRSLVAVSAGRSACRRWISCCSS
jgi:lipid-binding SYLF domain-containing protein